MSRRSRLLPRLTPLLLGVLAGCSGSAWPIAPAGPQAERISALWWGFAGVGLALWVVTLCVIVWAVMRGRRRGAPDTAPATDRRLAVVVARLVGLTVAILFVLALADFLTTRGLAEAPAEAPLIIEVTGHRWWWELTYEPDRPELRFATANEFRIPVGRPVLLRLTSRDVIHSFWVPALQGKRDLIPGYTNTLLLEADQPGVYRGGCAEFCGLQHGKMRLEVVAQPAEAFDAWYALQLAPAAAPRDSLALRGQEVFVTRACALCHSIRGTPARGQVAPDLTHLATRRTLAAGILPNTRGRLGGWIVNPQHLKRGTPMPPNPLPGEDLHALLHYLEGLR